VLQVFDDNGVNLEKIIRSHWKIIVIHIPYGRQDVLYIYFNYQYGMDLKVGDNFLSFEQKEYSVQISFVFNSDFICVQLIRCLILHE